MTNVLLILMFSLSSGGAAHADDPSGHVLTEKYRQTCGLGLDALIEHELDLAEARASSCLAEIIYDRRRKQAFTKPIIDTCTTKMVEHARGAPDEETTLRDLFAAAYGPIYRANCLDREVRAFRAEPAAPYRPATSSAI